MIDVSHQIEKHIESTRSNLGSNLRELEQMVKRSADWRTHFDRNPSVILGLALGGGALLGMIAGGKAHRPAPVYGNDLRRSAEGSNGNKVVTETWGTVKGALVALTVEKVRDLVNEALPGFGVHYDRLHSRRSSSSQVG